MAALVIIVLIILGVSLYDYFDSRSWQHITCVDRINVVFEERNKKYGAYSIRRDYNDLVLYIILGLLGVVGLFAIVTTSMRIAPEEMVIPQVEMDTTLLTLEAPPLDPIETLPTPYKIVGGGGSGTPDNSKYDPTPNDMTPSPGLKPTDKPIKPGKGNKDNGTNTNEEASTTVYNPFSSGTGGSGGGDKGGRGKGLGNDDGNGIGNGPNGNGGGSIVRKLLITPDFSGIHSDENCMVYLSIRVDENGNVVGTPSNVRTKSTTDNSVIINAVIQRVKSQAKFNKSPGASIIALTIPFNISAN